MKLSTILTTLLAVAAGVPAVAQTELNSRPAAPPPPPAVPNDRVNAP
ncbi:MAG: hypothetical protein H7Z21_06870, partial [Hymenobacter sp.]|nr:hypothetical protein [Hymenobacter sp.]